ncbi:MAG: penicillin acylase family protein [Salinibacter sp.]
MSLRRVLVLGALLLGTGALLYGLSVRVGGLPPLGSLLDPADGLYRTARTAPPTADTTRVALPGLDSSVTILRDQRHVPHIFASSDRAATMALGYVVAQDRLFQLDFLPRVASGRLSEAVGAQAIPTDRFLRRTGMEWGAQKNLARIRDADGIEHDALRWYSRGVNAYLQTLSPADLPLEFRLLGYRPDRFSPIQGLRLLQYMTFDLTYESDDPAYSRLRRRLSTADYERLYPERPPGLFDPSIPPSAQLEASSASAAAGPERDVPTDSARGAWEEELQALGGHADALRPSPTNGSNQWAVRDGKSATDGPLLAGDMHLSLSLPSIWYEAHLVTPTTNAYGLTIPGAPVLIQAFTRTVGWTLTNTGADQIDHYALPLDSSRTRYRFEGEWHALRREIDTIDVNHGAPVLDTLYYARQGPVHFSDTGGETAIAEQWVGHKSSRTLRALWTMNRAPDVAAVTEALRDWDTPMQTVLYAGRGDTIAIRAAGHLPVRRSGDGRGLLDGTSAEHGWDGRVPFDSLPAAQNPAQGYLASANQAPTGSDYPYYLGHDWGDGYRSLRINDLLRARSAHDVDDFKDYQTDVQVQQHEVFAPLLKGLTGLSARADTLRHMLQDWDGAATVDPAGPLVMDAFLSALRRLAWDEPMFAAHPKPKDAVLMDLLQESPRARWLDIQGTDQRETGTELVAAALETAADTMAARYGWTPGAWRWGDHHHLRLNHLTDSDALGAVGRGPFEMPGFEATLWPGRGYTVTHSASQRVIIDFSTSPPTGFGVYPGGQSGRPLAGAPYDAFVPAYLNGEYFQFRTPASPADLPSGARRAKLVLTPE